MQVIATKFARVNNTVNRIGYKPWLNSLRHVQPEAVLRKIAYLKIKYKYIIIVSYIPLCIHMYMGLPTMQTLSALFPPHLLKVK